MRARSAALACGSSYPLTCMNRVVRSDFKRIRSSRSQSASKAKIRSHCGTPKEANPMPIRSFLAGQAFDPETIKTMSDAVRGHVDRDRGIGARPRPGPKDLRPAAAQPPTSTRARRRLRSRRPHIARFTWDGGPLRALAETNADPVNPPTARSLTSCPPRPNCPRSATLVRPGLFPKNSPKRVRKNVNAT
jgi:hypothetical protein